MVIKYKAEIDKMFEDTLRESWMDDEDWEEFNALMSKRFNYEKMYKDIETGIKNGYSLEYQMELCKQVLRKMKEDDN